MGTVVGSTEVQRYTSQLNLNTGDGLCVMRNAHRPSPITHYGRVAGVGPRQLAEEKRLGSRKRPGFGLRRAFPGQKVGV